MARRDDVIHSGDNLLDAGRALALLTGETHWSRTMIDVPYVDKLISHAMRRGQRKWKEPTPNIATASRRERIAHIINELERLGHSTLSAELLRLENIAPASIRIPPAA